MLRQESQTLFPTLWSFLYCSCALCENNATEVPDVTFSKQCSTNLKKDDIIIKKLKLYADKWTMNFFHYLTEKTNYNCRPLFKNRHGVSKKPVRQQSVLNAGHIIAKCTVGGTVAWVQECNPKNKCQCTLAYNSKIKEVGMNHDTRPISLVRY